MSLPFLIRSTALIIGLSVCARAVEIEVDESAAGSPHALKDPGTRVAAPEVAAASNEGIQALDRMKLPPELKASLWAAEPMLANPVAFNIDEHGRVFVAETYRYRSSVLDIRDYLWMLEDDLACRTIEDRTKMVTKRLGEAGAKELAIETEQVRLLEDRDGDGKADFSTVYATGFTSALDGIASGVLARRGDVYFTNIPSLWKFTGRDKAETRVELSRGYGVRFNFTGHDLHGLTFGPDGKIYFSVGDRGAHVPTKEGGVVDAPDSGSVFRCNPDGSQLEIFASGLRNPQSLLFTENGDLLTGDNDSDQGDEERLVHVVENGDSGWRVGYQHAPLGNAGPWNSEKMWHQRHAEQAAFLLAPICNIEDGPSGVAYYPGTGLNPSYRGSIFVTHFKGSIPRSGIYDYKVKPNGASYSITDAKPFLTFALPTDVKFGTDGRLYYSDWAEGWPKSKRGRIYAISDPQHVNDPLVKETHVLIGSDFTKKTPAELAKLLGHVDWRVRLEAQYTLAERGSASVAVFADVVRAQTSAPYARLHAIWGLGQLASGSHANALTSVRELVRDSDPEVRAQAIKVLGDNHANDAYDAMIAALKDESARVKFFAGQSLGKLKRAESAPALVDALRTNNDADNYVRHALVMGLVGGHNLQALAAAATDSSRAVRLGVLLAYRRLGMAEAAQFLKDSDRLIVREAALAINDAPINAAMPALAALSEQHSDDNAVMIRAINARFRLGRSEDAKALAAYAARGDGTEQLRSEAVTQLALWAKPPARDRIVGVFRPVANATRDAATARDALTASLPAILAEGTPETVQIAALSALEGFNGAGASDTLVKVITDAKQPGATRAAALKALDKAHDPRIAEIVTVAGQSDSPQLRLAALPIAARLSPESAAPLLARLVENGNADEQRTAYRTLANLDVPMADSLLAAQLKRLSSGNVAPAAQLELLEAAAKRSDPAIKKLLATRDAALASDPNPLAPYLVALEGGDPKRGARIFASQPVMACVRCHSAGMGGGDAGPNLAMIGTRHDRSYLLESVVKPSAKIAPGFDSIVVTLKSGKMVGGVVAEEAPQSISLKNADGKTVVVTKSDIARREGAPSSMPEIYGAVLTKTELRDVVAFLASLTKPAQDTADASQPRALRGPPKI
ncbi:MAG: HEAT repeat domain-containing protein [Opitutus sp.]